MKKYLKVIIPVIAVVFGLIAAFMIFAPASVTKIGDISTKGSDIAFGNEKLGLAASAYILAFLLTLLGAAFAVVAIFGAMGKLGKVGKIAPIIAAVLFIVGGIFFFLPSELVTATDQALLLYGGKADVFRDAMKKANDIGAGAIVGGVFAIISAIASVVSFFFAKKA